MSDTGKPAETDRPSQDPPKDPESEKDSDSPKSFKPPDPDPHDPDFGATLPEIDILAKERNASS